MSKQAKKAPSRGRSVTLLVPMLAENWALSLATGFIGGKPRHDAATDAQSLFEGGVVGARSKVPGWLLHHGEPGARIVLELSVPVKELEEAQDFLVVRGLHRVTQVKACQFPSSEAKKDFEATYGAFPDVPMGIVPAVVKKLPDTSGRGLDLPPSQWAADGLEGQRQALDIACGWVAGLASLFQDPELDTLYSAVPSDGLQGEKGLAGLPGQALMALAPDASEVDLAIWRAVAAALLAPAAQRASGRQGVLTAVEDQLQREGALGNEALAWLAKTSDVISAKCDLPPLGDDGSIGRRAALAAVIGDAPGNLPLGTRVAALVSLVSCASTGFTRIEATGVKDDLPALDAMLSLGQDLAGGSHLGLDIVAGGLDAEFCAEEALQAEGNILARRKRPAPAWATPLAEAARRAGLLLAPAKDSGLLCIALDGEGSEHVHFEGIAGPKGQELRAWVTLAGVKGKSPGLKAMGGLLEAAWRSGTQVGIRKQSGGDVVCAFASAPLDQFDARAMIGTAQQLGSKVPMLRESLS